jgi:hypothetical protein
MSPAAVDSPRSDMFAMKKNRCSHMPRPKARTTGSANACPIPAVNQIGLWLARWKRALEALVHVVVACRKGVMEER